MKKVTLKIQVLRRNLSLSLSQTFWHTPSENASTIGQQRILSQLWILRMASCSFRRWALALVATGGILGAYCTRARVYIASRIITYSRGMPENCVSATVSHRCDTLSFAAGLRARGSRTFAIVASEIGQLTAPMTLIFPNNSHLWPHAAAASDVRRNFRRPLVIYSRI